jgi:hypothetical protein
MAGCFRGPMDQGQMHQNIRKTFVENWRLFRQQLLALTLDAVSGMNTHSEVWVALLHYQVY